MITAGVRAQSEAFVAASLQAVRPFSAFDAGNDPHGEHDFGALAASGEPDRPSVEFTGAGLRIRGGRHFVVHTRDKPLFAGKATLALARRDYGTSDPKAKQLELF